MVIRLCDKIPNTNPRFNLSSETPFCEIVIVSQSWFRQWSKFRLQYSVHLGFPAPVPLSTYHGGRVAETEWGPLRGSATQNWFKKYITKTNKLQIPEPLPRRITPTTRSIPLLRLAQRDRNLTSSQRTTTPLMILLPSTCHVDFTLRFHYSRFL